MGNDFQPLSRTTVSSLYLFSALHSSQSTAIKLREYAIQMKIKKEPVKKSVLSVSVVLRPMVFSMDVFIIPPPILRFSHIISGLFDNYGQTGKKNF